MGRLRKKDPRPELADAGSLCARPRRASNQREHEKQAVEVFASALHRHGIPTSRDSLLSLMGLPGPESLER